MFSETVFGAGPSLRRIVLFAARQEPTSLEEPQGRTAGPALQASGVGGVGAVRGPEQEATVPPCGMLVVT